MKRLSMVKQKTVEPRKNWEKSGRISPVGKKGSCMNQMT